MLMAIVRKTAVLQVRCLSEQLEAFQAACDLFSIKPTDAVRRFMDEETFRLQKRAETNAAQRARKQVLCESAKQALVPVKKQVVEPIRKPQTLSEKRAAEKAAKNARKAKKADRF